MKRSNIFVPALNRAHQWRRKVQLEVTRLLWPEIKRPASSRDLWRGIRHEVAPTWGRHFHRACAGLLSIFLKWRTEGEPSSKKLVSCLCHHHFLWMCFNCGDKIRINFTKWRKKIPAQRLLNKNQLWWNICATDDPNNKM